MIEFNHPAHGKAIAEAAGCILHPEDVTISRVTSKGNLMGGVLFKNFTGASIAIHCASFTPNWLSRDLLWVMFHYAFEQLGVKKVIGPVPSSNLGALAFDYKVGFKYVTTVPGVFPDGDLIVLEMDRASCRWLNIQPRHLRGS